MDTTVLFVPHTSPSFVEYYDNLFYRKGYLRDNNITINIQGLSPIYKPVCMNIGMFFLWILKSSRVKTGDIGGTLFHISEKGQVMVSDNYIVSLSDYECIKDMYQICGKNSMDFICEKLYGKFENSKTLFPERITYEESSPQIRAMTCRCLPFPGVFKTDSIGPIMGGKLVQKYETRDHNRVFEMPDEKLRILLESLIPPLYNDGTLIVIFFDPKFERYSEERNGEKIFKIKIIYPSVVYHIDQFKKKGLPSLHLTAGSSDQYEKYPHDESFMRKTKQNVSFFERINFRRNYKHNIWFSGSPVYFLI